MRGMMAWAGFPQFGLEYERDERYAGETKYNLRKMIRLALDGIVSFSPKPLFLAGYLGTAVTGGSLLLIVWLVISRLFGLGTVVTGWSSLLAVMLFLWRRAVDVAGHPWPIRGQDLRAIQAASPVHRFADLQFPSPAAQRAVDPRFRQRAAGRGSLLLLSLLER